MEKKYQIFISSTYKDLIPEREHVRDAILSMYQFPIGMEMFSAANEDQWEIIKETIDSSDYYVLIIGKRYGTMISDGKDAGISYTQKEYNYAKSIRIPIFVYIKNEKSISADNVDIDAIKQERLSAFIEEVKNGREVKWFDNADQLATFVSHSLYKAMSRQKRPGWVRGDNVDIEECLNQITFLSKRNQQLEEENRLLIQKQEKRAPQIDIEMACRNMLSEKEEKEECFFERNIVVNAPRIVETGYLDVPEYLVISDLSAEDRNNITEEDIRKYNEGIKEIEKYNKDLKAYNEICSMTYYMDFAISNKGTLKANDLNIVLTFPQEIGLIERKEIKRIEKPVEPPAPINPLIAKKESNHLFSNIIDALDTLSKEDGGYRRRLPIDLLSSQDYIGYDFDINQENNSVEIWIKNLLHNTEKESTGLCVVIPEAGSYKVGVSIICEEFEQPIEDELSLDVI